MIAYLPTPMCWTPLTRDRTLPCTMLHGIVWQMRSCHVSRFIFLYISIDNIRPSYLMSQNNPGQTHNPIRSQLQARHVRVVCHCICNCKHHATTIEPSAEEVELCSFCPQFREPNEYFHKGCMNGHWSTAKQTSFVNLGCVALHHPTPSVP